MSDPKVSIVAASKCAFTGKKIVTFELDYWRAIHAEFMTHRLFSRNAASSRAIPIAKMLEMVSESPAGPLEWGANQPGMQAKVVFSGWRKATAIWAWNIAAKAAVNSAKILDKCGLHKQIVNRVLEPFCNIKVVITSTEFENFFWLRNHPDAQPEIKELARLMWEQYNEVKFKMLDPGQWHVPYYQEGYWIEVRDGLDKFGSTLADALAISSSCSAQVSYRKLDDTLEKARMVYGRLVESEPVHASPFEHQATPLRVCLNQDPFDVEGITHIHKDMGAGSGNFYGWIQHRQLIANHSRW